jgi:hypothetical protein
VLYCCTVAELLDLLLAELLLLLLLLSCAADLLLLSFAPELYC